MTVDTKLLATEIVAKMQEDHNTLWITREVHSEQHEFIQLLMQERQEKLARGERLKEKIAGSLILSFIVGLVTLLGVGVLTYLRDYLK